MKKSGFSRLLEDIERAGEKVLSTRQEIIDLDRRRNSNREAIRGLEKHAREHYKGLMFDKIFLFFLVLIPVKKKDNFPRNFQLRDKNTYNIVFF